jgi:hypothetical protein
MACACPTGSGARRSVGLARQLQGGANGTEFLWIQCRLDAPKQRPLLMAHVIPQTLAESVQGRRVDGRTSLEVADPAANVHVLDEHTYDIRVVSPGVTRKCRQQRLLLKAEVLAALLAPEVERRLPDGLGIDIGRALQPKSQLESHVMLARQHS